MAFPHASIEIAAPAARVLALLKDLRLYAELAAFVVSLEGTAVAPGEALDMVVEMTPGAALRRQRVVVVDAGRADAIAWTFTMGAPFLLHAVREQVVEATGPQSCRYATTDAMSGLLAGLVLYLYGDTVSAGLARFAAALKARAERDN